MQALLDKILTFALEVLGRLKTRSMIDYFRNGISIDCLLFTVIEQKLQALLLRRKHELFNGEWSLPGRLLRSDMEPEYGLMRIMESLTGRTNVYYKQIRAFTGVNRHPQGRVVAIAYYGLTHPSKIELGTPDMASEVAWFPIDEVPEMPFDHNDILHSGLRRLRRRVHSRPVIVEMLPDRFSMPELQRAYELVLGEQFDKRNFRKRFLESGLLEKLDEFQKSPRTRPAQLYRVIPDQYQRLRRKGFTV